MGFAYRDSCYPTVIEAAKAQCVQSYPFLWGNGSSLYSIRCDGWTANGQLVLTKTIDGFYAGGTYAGTSFPSCDPNTFLKSGAESLDPAKVASVFSVAFAFVVLFYLVARGAGSVLSLIRRG